MKRFMSISIFLILLTATNPLLAKDIPFAQEDRDRLIRLDTKLDAMEKRFDDINNHINPLASIFTAIVIAVIGFAIWDRRTMVRPF